MIPPLLLERVGPVRHFEGDPHFAGLFDPWTRGQWTELYGGDPESREVRARAMYSPMTWRPASDRQPMITYFSRTYVRPAVVLHEFGHHVMGTVDWRLLPTIPHRPTRIEPDTYAERFAEAFAAWLLPRVDHHMTVRDGRYRGAAERLLLGGNQALLALFNELAGLPADMPPRALTVLGR